MKNKKFFSIKVLIPLLLPLFILPSCGDKECKQTVQDVAFIQNQTGYSMPLFLCKGGYGESQIQLLPTTAGLVNLGTHEETAGKADALGACKTKNVKNNNLVLTLSPNSYGIALLCYRQMDNTYLVIHPLYGCPVGYVEQSSTEPCLINTY